MLTRSEMMGTISQRQKRPESEQLILESLRDWFRPQYTIRDFDYWDIWGFCICPSIMVPEYWTNFFWYKENFCSSKGNMLGRFFEPTATWIDWYSRIPEVRMKLDVADPDLLEWMLQEIRKRP